MYGRGNSYNFFIVFTVALGSFTYGYSSSIIGSVFGLPSFFSYFNLSLSGSNSASIIGAANGLFAGGGMIGCILVGLLADKIGRVRTIQVLCTIGVTAAIMQAASVHIAMFLVGRLLGGVSAGMANCIVPIYQSEISPPTQRGRMVGSHGFLVVSGYAGAAWTGFGSYFEKNPAIQWRLCLALQVIAPALLLIATPWIPESPRWLVLKDKTDEALNILVQLHKTPEDPDDSFARQEYRHMHHQLQLESSYDHSIMAIFKQSHTRKRFFTGFFLQCLAQSTGVLVTSNYQVLLWNNLGLTGSIPLLLYGVYTTFAASLNLFSSFILDHVGRTKLLKIGFAGCIVMFSCFTALVATYAGTSSKVGNAFAVLALFIWLAFYASCIDATSYVYCAEIFPTHMRTQGVAASIFGLFAMTLAYTEPASTAFANIGWKYYLLFIILPAVGYPILFFFPETKGLSLEDIAAVFGDIVVQEQQLEPAKQDLEGSETIEYVNSDNAESRDR